MPRLVGVALLLALVLAAARRAGAQPDAKSDLYVLSVGVEPQLTVRGKLDIYAQDAQFVADALAAAKSQYRNVIPTVLKGKQATRGGVLAALDGLKAKVRAEDVVVVFFSTHGNFEPASGYTISLAITPKSKGASEELGGADLQAAVAALKGRAVVVLDTCCAAGAIPKAGAAPQVAYLTACRRAESSYGQSDDTKRPHGYFVIAVCEGLKGLADQNGDGAVTVKELEQYATKRATALCGEQHAVNRTPAELTGVVLTRVEKGAVAKSFEPEGKRNPFGQKDVDKPLGEDVKAFAAKTRVPGDDKDANAQAWNKLKQAGSRDTIEGEWEYRWGGGTAGTGWVRGTAQVKIVDDRVFIMCRDGTSKYLIETRRGVNERIVGRYVNLNDAGDTSPFVARVIAPDRIDGFWGEGRWDLRRNIEGK